MSAEETKPENEPGTEDPAPQHAGVRDFARKVASLFGGGWAGMTLATVGMLLVVAATAVLIYLCWLKAIPSVAEWGFSDWTISKIWKSLLAILGVFYLAVIPFLPFGLAPMLLTFVAELTSYRRDVRTARAAQQDIEEALSQNDPHQIVMVLRYSRQLLGEYYALGMHQAQRSYRYALIAMWLGFLVLLACVANQLGWLKAVFPNVFAGPVVQDNTVVLLTGTVMEFIAAAFLWVYRTSTQQLIYFYRRQFMLHRTLLASRMARGMAARGDEATFSIIEKLLVEVEDLKTEAATGGGFSKLLGKAES